MFFKNSRFWHTIIHLSCLVSWLTRQVKTAASQLSTWQDDKKVISRRTLLRMQYSGQGKLQPWKIEHPKNHCGAKICCSDGVTLPPWIRYSPDRTDPTRLFRFLIPFVEFDRPRLFVDNWTNDLIWPHDQTAMTFPSFLRLRSKAVWRSTHLFERAVQSFASDEIPSLRCQNVPYLRAVHKCWPGYSFYCRNALLLFSRQSECINQGHYLSQRKIPDTSQRNLRNIKLSDKSVLFQPPVLGTW